jgi:glycogen synthase kinase 3 beta
MGHLVSETHTPNLTTLGYVFEAYDNNRNCKVAVKRTQKSGNIVSREYEILNLLQGQENIVQMLDFFYSRDRK